jgi:hypothetical protein
MVKLSFMMLLSPFFVRVIEMQGLSYKGHCTPIVVNDIPVIIHDIPIANTVVPLTPNTFP